MGLGVAVQSAVDLVSWSPTWSASRSWSSSLSPRQSPWPAMRCRSRRARPHLVARADRCPARSSSASPLVVIVTVRVFLGPARHRHALGLPTSRGLVDLLVSGTLFYVLIKIPSGFSGYILGGGRHGGLAGLVEGLVACRLARAAMGASPAAPARMAVAAFGRGPAPAGARPSPGSRPGADPGEAALRSQAAGKPGVPLPAPAGRDRQGRQRNPARAGPMDAAPPLPDGAPARPARHAAPPPLPGGGSGRLARHSKPPPLQADLRPRPPARPTAGTRRAAVPPRCSRLRGTPSPRRCPADRPGTPSRRRCPPPACGPRERQPRAGRPSPPAAPAACRTAVRFTGNPARRTPPAVPPPAVPRRRHRSRHGRPQPGVPPRDGRESTAPPSRKEDRADEPPGP